MPEQVALLDTTIQIDWQKSGVRRRRIAEILEQFDWKVTTSICLLEFKATLIQECITIHDRLRAVGRYTLVVDYLTESNHPQAKLRGHIFRNLIDVYAQSSFIITEEKDQRLAEKARLRLERVIPHLYEWFTRQSVDAVLSDAIECTRALEAPRKKTVAFGVNLPKCQRGKNKSCHVEDFIRSHSDVFLKQLRAAIAGMGDEDAKQLERACELFEAVRDDAKIELSHSDCRRAGDCLIVLEGSEHATHALSTNARDWEPVCELVGCSFVRVDYPEEKEI